MVVFLLLVIIVILTGGWALVPIFAVLAAWGAWTLVIMAAAAVAAVIAAIVWIVANSAERGSAKSTAMKYSERRRPLETLAGYERRMGYSRDEAQP